MRRFALELLAALLAVLASILLWLDLAIAEHPIFYYDFAKDPESGALSLTRFEWGGSNTSS